MSLDTPGPSAIVHVSLTVGPTGSDPRTRLVVGGVDLTRHCKLIKVDAGASAITDVWLELVGVTVDIEADVPRDRVQQMTHEEADAHEEAQRTVDTGRGHKDYLKAKPRSTHDGIATLVVGLGEVMP